MVGSDTPTQRMLTPSMVRFTPCFAMFASAAVMIVSGRNRSRPSIRGIRSIHATTGSSRDVACYLFSF